MPVQSRISLLDNRLANQIAAGEVVERPASVVKELMENSVDSGATRIDLDIERGGTRLVRVTDNGKGIHQDDLRLALTRHATSKIQTTEDLANIQSLGFRGEALASISAVSKLTLTSRPHDAELAWQAIAQGRDMAVEVTPAAAAVGTRIEVVDLFYNTPARQKFLRTEKTEFAQIEEVFKRQALANFEIAFVLTHNHKMIKRVSACGEPAQQLARIAALCGKAFAENIIPFDCAHELMHIHGWLGSPNYHRSESDIQYVFINRRPVKDKTLNHAIRQAYEGLLPAGRMAAYVIYLEIDPQQVDVNVHPTKHEVRFGQQRLVHDLLVKSISDAIRQDFTMSGSSERMALRDEEHSNSEEHNSPEENNHSYYQGGVVSPVVQTPSKSAQFHATRPQPAYSSQAVMDYAKQHLTPPANTDIQERATHYAAPTDGNAEVISSLTASAMSHNNTSPSAPIVNSSAASSVNSCDLGSGYWVVIRGSNESSPQAYLLDIKRVLQDYLHALIGGSKKSEASALLFPQRINVDEFVLEDFQLHQRLELLGFAFTVAARSELLVRGVPRWLSGLSNAQIIQWLSDNMTHFSQLKDAELVEQLSMAPSLYNAVLSELLVAEFTAADHSSSGLTRLLPELAEAALK